MLLNSCFVCFEQLLNKLDEFEEAVKKTVQDVRFDNDIVVSVFETNIRVLGYGSWCFFSFGCVYLFLKTLGKKTDQEYSRF